MAGKISVKTPAKINVGLNIIEKRKDNFHNLETIFYPIGIFDTIHFSESDKFTFISDNEMLNREHDNLIIKAKNLLEKESGDEIKVKISLEKKIPIGAGLGGGSSDAAAVLKVLNEILKLNIQSARLAELALQLGSDVPFFLNPLPSFAESRGEILEQLNLKIEEPILLINPGIHVSTAWAFSKIKPADPAFPLWQITRLYYNYKEWREKVINDFENPVFEEYPQIRKIKEELYNFGAAFALMTGSGSTLFSIFSDKDRAAAAEEYFKEKKYFTFLEAN